MTMATKKLTIIDDGGIYDISSNEEFKDLLESLETKYLENVDTGRRVVGYLSLTDGGKYMVKLSKTNVISVSDVDQQSSENEAPQDVHGKQSISVGPSEKEGVNDNLEVKKSHPKWSSSGVPKAVVVRRASNNVKRGGRRDSLGQRRKQQFDRRQKKLLETATKLVKEGNDLAKQGKYNEAMAIYKRLLKIRLIVLGRHHPNVGSACSNVGSILYVQGEYKEAMSMYQTALNIQLKVHGNTSHADVAQLYFNMAKVLKLQSKYEESREMYQKSLSRYLELYGEEHAKVVDIRKSLANPHMKQEVITQGA